MADRESSAAEKGLRKVEVSGGELFKRHPGCWFYGPSLCTYTVSVKIIKKSPNACGLNLFTSLALRGNAGEALLPSGFIWSWPMSNFIWFGPMEASFGVGQ